MTRILFFLSLFLFSGCTKQTYYVEQEPIPVLATISIIDRNGFSETISNPDRLVQFENTDFLSNQPYQKVLRVYRRNGSGDVCSYITSYYPNGHPKQYLEVVNNRAFGVYKEWHQNGILALETFIIGGEADLTKDAEKTWLFDGYSRAWDESGYLAAEIPYRSGELEGISIYYHANGNIWKRVTFHQDKLEGDFEMFLECGQLLQSVHYVNNIKEGSASRYWSEGCPAATEEYCNGNLVTGHYYDREGKLLSKIENGNGYKATFGKDNINELQQYINGFQEGEVQGFAEDGRLVTRYMIKDGIKHGEEVVYYDTAIPSPQLSINWVEGRIQGLVKTWYTNGVMESQREMSENTKNGTSTAWYNDSSVMLIEEYDHDKLIEGRYFFKKDKLPVSEVHKGKGIATIFDPDGNLLTRIIYNNSKPLELDACKRQQLRN